ncbi:hypothetical protein H6G81_35180 [Scytonema hofmannii FACHB-248]|uniref:Uncharacterized protein n=1 Tax=Scytonema hofmannii FACHB-248 TaxID=1842502 RepID=A0ABR8H1A3_9CYAN|nr:MULTISPECIES: hypothetical protein [Nostocales]MBD2609596.1 hypothetical protein [Scytonema hofmannii FACHB-248]
MKPKENPLDPTFWEALGITPIVIDDSTPERFEVGFDQLSERIESEVSMIFLSSQIEDK